MTNQMTNMTYREYKLFKEEMIQKANNKCSQCGVSGNRKKLILHHIDGEFCCDRNEAPKKNNHPDNVIAICRSCHSKIHGLAVTGYPLTLRLKETRNKIYFDVWQQYKGTYTMQEISQMLRMSLAQFSKLVKKQSKKEGGDDNA